MNEGRGRGKRRLVASLASHFPFPGREMPRDKIILACNECKNRNYFTTKNKRLHPDKMEIRKFDPVVRKHVAYKETKIK